MFVLTTNRGSNQWEKETPLGLSRCGIPENWESLIAAIPSLAEFLSEGKTLFRDIFLFAPTL